MQTLRAFFTKGWFKIVFLFVLIGIGIVGKIAFDKRVAFDERIRLEESQKAHDAVTAKMVEGDVCIQKADIEFLTAMNGLCMAYESDAAVCNEIKFDQMKMFAQYASARHPESRYPEVLRKYEEDLRMCEK